MIPWKLLDKAQAPGDGEELTLYQRDDEFTIMAGTYELMNSRIHGSEDALADMTCQKLAHHPKARVLIGGLGMGFTLRAALNGLGADAQVIVSELVPAVVTWNRSYLAELAHNPLADERVIVEEVDVSRLIRKAKRHYNAILLDVDNGPQALTTRNNEWLYSPRGLDAAYDALQPGGVLAIWSPGADAAFSKRLSESGFDIDEIKVPARGKGKGKRGGYHYIWTAIRG
jgi:spermidine synthase